jgi:hypothetical protein
LPTLDTPIPKGKSAIWCASFQLAWERLKKEITKGPVKLLGAEATAQRLNDAPSVAETLNSEGTYATAGFVRDGIGPAIRREMKQRFPGVRLVDFEEFPGGAVAYAYLRATVAFTHPFLEIPRPLSFVSADGSKKAVLSFGLPYEIRRERAVEQQVEILHTVSNEWGLQETFVLDPCKDSLPYQVLVARMPRQPTLAKSLVDMERRIAGPNDKELLRPLRFFDGMLVPHLRVRINHRFKELEGREMAELGMTLDRAFQQIEFRLDARGVTLESQSVMTPKADPREFVANRPFLVVLRKRGTARPFFVLWVENAELLEAWK